MLKEIIWVVVWTILPITELRASIPLGILKYNLSPWVVVATAIIANIIIGIVIYLLLGKIVLLLQRFPKLKRFYDKTVIRIQKKISKPVEKWGWIALAVFIGIPLPGSGVYSGAIAAEVVGIDLKRFVWAAIIGVLIAAAIVTAIVLTGTGLASVFISHI
jgi:uncharacterized membrane protein